MLNSSQPGFIVWGPAQTFLFHDACRPLLGDRAAWALGRSLPEIGDLWGELSRVVSGVLAGEAVCFKERKFTLQRDGQPADVWLTGTASPIRDQQGALVGAFCMVVETTEAVLAARQLEAELERRRQLFDQAPTFIAFLRGPDHVYELVNGAYLQMVGQQDITGKPAREALPELVEQGYVNLLDQVYRSGESFVGREMSYTPQRHAGESAPEERCLDIVYQPIRDATGSVIGVLAEGFDVTERSAAEKALRHHAETLQDQVEVRTQDLRPAEAALRQAQKMQALGQLTGGIAHDFNNLLLGINGALGLAERRLRQGRPDEVGRFIALAMNSANRATGLTHRLLAFARRQPLTPKPVRVGPLIASMQDMLRRTTGEAIELELILDEGGWPALCDANQLESAILNLSINARDAMPDGGKLTIATYNARISEADAARLHNVKPGDYVCIAVSDTGAGMAPEVLSRVFEPFFTTKPIGQGTGLGLPMIYGFARQSGGYVQIDSAPGRGTKVMLYLPRSYQEAEEEATPVELTEVHRAEEGEAVLVVEDDEAVRQVVVEVLHELGYRTLEAADGPMGLKILQSPTKLDLLITDIGLPGLNGRQMVEAVKALRPDLRVLYMTAYAQTPVSGKGWYRSGMEVIAKPFAMDDLALRIREVMGTADDGQPPVA
jgi:PAS domain S-box-containing protein